MNSNNIDKEMRAVWDEVRVEVENEVWWEVRREVWVEVRNEVMGEVWVEVRREVWNSLLNNE
jgi:hypothetical protein